MSEVKYCAKCERCHEDGLAENEDCEYYGEPCGCNHPNRGFTDSENETVAEIKYRIYSHWRGCENCSLEEMDGADLIAIADQFEAAHRREVAELKRKCEEYERQPELMAETAKAALELLKAQDAEIAALRAKLKVAEDALAKLQDRFVSSVHDGTIDPYEALKIAEDALAAIREEGGSK